MLQQRTKFSLEAEQESIGPLGLQDRSKSMMFRNPRQLADLSVNVTVDIRDPPLAVNTSREVNPNSIFLEKRACMPGVTRTVCAFVGV